MTDTQILKKKISDLEYQNAQLKSIYEYTLKHYGLAQLDVKKWEEHFEKLKSTEWISDHWLKSNGWIENNYTFEKKFNQVLKLVLNPFDKENTAWAVSIEQFDEVDKGVCQHVHPCDVRYVGELERLWDCLTLDYTYGIENPNYK